MASKPNRPPLSKSNEDGSGTPLGTSVMVTVVVMSPKRLTVNVPGPVKLGLTKVEKGRLATPEKHGPVGTTAPAEQPVELPLRLKSVTVPRRDVS
jgi:hypothetical protein